MPKYVYQCTKCKQEIEIEHSIKEDAKTHQKHLKSGKTNVYCNGKLKRLISCNSFCLKGTGWTPKHYS